MTRGILIFHVSESFSFGRAYLRHMSLAHDNEGIAFIWRAISTFHVMCYFLLHRTPLFTLHL